MAIAELLVYYMLWNVLTMNSDCMLNFLSIIPYTNYSIRAGVEAGGMRGLTLVWQARPVRVLY